MEWNTQQAEAIEQVIAWHSSRVAPIFRLFGYAGTGKTTLAKHIAEKIKGRVVFAAYTGKAAHVLQQKGCPSACTIHSLIYTPKNKSEVKLKEMVAEQKELMAGALNEVEQARIKELTDKIKLETKSLDQPAFSLNLTSDIHGSALIVIDECSMVGNEMAQDLMSFEVPILVLGDPAQLPPVASTGYFTEAEPDYMLTEVVRQAEGNPIIELATTARNKGKLSPGQYGQSLVHAKISGPPDYKDVLEADQILVGRNITRHACNKRVRQLKGYDTWIPRIGEKLVCLRNDHEEGLLNGSLWRVEDVGAYDEDFDIILLELLSDDGEDRVVCTAHGWLLRGEDKFMPFWERKDAQEFSYGYALTVHKSQGSQWGHVFLFDESASFGQTWWRWLYTGITRAANKITIVV